MQTQCCTEAHCSPLGYFTIQSAILRLLEAAAAFTGSRLAARSFVHCNLVKSLRFHYDYIVLSFRTPLSLSVLAQPLDLRPLLRPPPSSSSSNSNSPPPPLRLVFHFLILIFLFRTRLVSRYFVSNSFQSCFVVYLLCRGFFPWIPGGEFS